MEIVGGVTMDFNTSYKFIKSKVENKVLTLEELKYVVNETPYFEITDWYFLTDGVTSDNNCSFNGSENSEGSKVINLDIEFINRRDFILMEDMACSNLDSVKVKVKSVNLYNIG